jgi:hypothetical protein
VNTYKRPVFVTNVTSQSSLILFPEDLGRQDGLERTEMRSGVSWEKRQGLYEKW